jgi:hypothetical protein
MTRYADRRSSPIATPFDGLAASCCFFASMSTYPCFFLTYILLDLSIQHYIPAFFFALFDSPTRLTASEYSKRASFIHWNTGFWFSVLRLLPGTAGGSPTLRLISTFLLLGQLFWLLLPSRLRSFGLGRYTNHAPGALLH